MGRRNRQEVIASARRRRISKQEMRKEMTRLGGVPTHRMNVMQGELTRLRAEVSGPTVSYDDLYGDAA